MGAGLVLAVALCASAAGAAPPVRREAHVTFTPDTSLLERGGVQYFYELIPARADATRSAAFRRLQPLDARRSWQQRREPLHVLLLRVVYLLEKDASFFSASRVQDVAYMNAILPRTDIRATGPDTFRAGRTPANTFTLRLLEGEALQRDSASRALQQLLPSDASPASVVLQENFDFARVMGVRTSERSYTYTAHLPVAPDRTQVEVYTLSLLYNVPPFFLGGEARVHEEALSGALTLIERLRAYPAP